MIRKKGSLTCAVPVAVISSTVFVASGREVVCRSCDFEQMHMDLAVTVLLHRDVMLTNGLLRSLQNRNTSVVQSEVYVTQYRL